MTSIHYQWGYAGIDSCCGCDTRMELWVHSAYQQVEPRCTRCSNTEILSKISTVEYEMHMNDAESNLENVAILTALRDLHYNSPWNCDIYGERASVCAMCFAVEEEDRILIDAILRNGEVVRAHLRCTHDCENCERTYARNTPISWRLARRLDIGLNRQGVDLNYLAPKDEWQCKPCIETYIAESEETFFQCRNCNSYDYHTESHWFNDERYCQTCFDDNVYECDECSESYWSDNGHDCSYDDEDDNYGVIHTYDYRPRPIFFGHKEARYFLGFELEVEAMNDDRGEGAWLAQNTLQEHAYMKSDGSLSDGFEIVTHPHTLEAYQELDWSVLDKLRMQGFRSWNTDTCGLHVHVSRTAFGNGDTRRVHEYAVSRQMHELRFMKLIYDNQRQVERLAGRQSNHYASFMDRGKLVEKVKFGRQSNGRYSVINTDNDQTIEVRIFRGSLRKERVMSALEFVTASVEYTRNLKVTGKNGALTWTHFVAYVVSHAENYPNLLAKMNESFDKDKFNSEESYA